ncbi:MAG: Sensor histidine kinase YycG [bacterium ADurb.Bin212]|nr:MAG: Sensor histidine kinase YycG [bacterium ADurb.Bin212]
MTKISNQKIQQWAEVLFWILVIFITIFVVSRFQWYQAEQILRYLSMAALIASVYFYLKNRTLLNESREKTIKLTESHKQLKSRQKTIDLIFNNSTDGILVLDQDKTIEEFSPGMEKITGYTRKDAIGRNAQELLKFSAEKNYSLLPDMMFTIATTQKEKYVENSLITKEGKIVDIEASHTLLQDSKSNSAMALAIVRDITYEKALIERDKEFITVTSHQLNTPLSIIRGYTSLLLAEKAGKLASKQTTFLKEIMSSTEKMIELVGSMLSISRIEQEKIKLKIIDVNLSDIIGSVSKSLEGKAEEKHISLVIKDISKDIVIMADQDHLRQAFSNIIENAIKYTQKGRVTISVTDRPEVVDVTVADTGIGIPEREIEKIGTRFFRSQNAIDVDNHGSGLGIYIAKTVIEKHHGHIKIDSVVNKGTKITLTLPKKQPMD